MTLAVNWSDVLEVVQHVAALSALALITVAPIPLCLVFCVAHAGGRRVSSIHFAVIAGIAWLSIQTFVALVVGVFGCLNLWYVLLVETVLAGVGVILVVAQAIDLRQLRPTRRPSIAEALILACLTSVAASLLHHTATTPLSEYDTLAYHLPAVANWYRIGRLDMLGLGSVDFYPYNFELIALLFVLPFKGHFAIGLAQLLAWSLFGLAIYATATLLGARPLHALVSTLLVSVQPLILRLVSTLQVDLAFGASFAMTLYVALASVFGGSHWSLVVLSGAWLAGAKASGLVYLCLVAATMVIARATFPHHVARSTIVQASRPSSGVVLLSVLVSLINAGFWYGRNVLTSGNPLGLVGVSVLGFPLLDGPITASELSRSSLAAVFQIGDPGDWMTVGKQLAVQFWTPFALLLVGLVLLVTVPRPTSGVWPDPVAVLVLGLLIACAAAYAFTPFSGDNGAHGWRVTPWMGQALRFALPAVSVMGVAAALGMTRFGRLDILMAVLAAAVGLLSIPYHRLHGLLVCLVVWWLILRRRPPLPAWARTAAVFGCVIAIIVWSLLLRAAKDKAYARMFPVVTYIDRHVGEGEKIGLLVTSRASVFFGTRFTADVVFVPHGEPDSARWARLLRRVDVRFIGVGPIPEDWWLSSKEIGWLNGDHEHFEQVYGTDYRQSSVLYQLRDSTPARDSSESGIGSGTQTPRDPRTSMSAPPMLMSFSEQ